MADTTIVNLTATTAGADGDLLPVVDVSDTGQSPEGSTRKLTFANFKTYIANAITLVTPNLGTPSAGVLTNCTGLPTAGLVDASVTLAKMANLAQDQFIGRTTASTGVPQTATITSAARTVLDDTSVSAMVDTLGGASATGTGGLVRTTTPTLVTPVLGVATATSINGTTIPSSVTLATALAPVTLSGATNLDRATHGNRYLICDTAATLTVLDDTAGSWTDGDVLYGDNTSAGNVVLAADASGTTNTVTAETGHTLTVAAGRSWSLRRTGANAWRGGALEAAAAGGSMVAGYAAAGSTFYAEPLEINSPSWSAIGCGTTAIDTSTAGGVSSLFNTSYGFRRIQYTAAAAAANRGAGIRGGSAGIGFYPGGVRTGNFWFRGAFAAADALTGCRVFCGLKTGGEPTASAEPSTFTDVVFVGADTTDTNLQVMHNDSAGTCTKVDLGASFPANSNAVDMYEVTFKFNSGASRSVDYTVTNLVSGAAATGSLTTNLPTAGTSVNYAIYRNTGANTTACVIHIMGIKGGSLAGL